MQDIEKMGRREVLRDFSFSSRRLRQAIELEEEAINELDDLIRQYLDMSFFEYALAVREWIPFSELCNASVHSNERKERRQTQLVSGPY